MKEYSVDSELLTDTCTSDLSDVSRRAGSLTSVWDISSEGDLLLFVPLPDNANEDATKSMS